MKSLFFFLSLIIVPATTMAEEKNYERLVSKVMHDCKLHTQSSDIENRDIANEVLLGMNDTCKIEKPSSDIDSFLKDISKVVRSTDQKKIWDETTKISLQRSVTSLLQLHMRVVNKSRQLTYQEAYSIICSKVSNLCAKNRSEAIIIDKGIKEFLAEQETRPVKYLDSLSQEKFKNRFNELVSATNQTCIETKKKFDSIRLKYRCHDFPDLSLDSLKSKASTIKPYMLTSTAACDERLAKARYYHNQLYSQAEESIQISMQLLIKSELGPLFATESFRRDVGVLKPDFVYDNCMVGNGQILNPVWHKNINKARTELYQLALNELSSIDKKRQSPPRFEQIEADLEQFLKTYPLTISELLKQNPDPLYAKSVCYYIKDINRTDKIRKYVSLGLAGIGTIAGIATIFATGGLAVGAVSSTFVILTSVSAGSAAASIYQLHKTKQSLINDDKFTRQAMVTRQREIEQAIKAIDASDIKKEELDNQMFWTSAGVIAEVAGVGLTMKKALTVIDDLKRTPVFYEMVHGATKAQKAEKLVAGSKKLNSFIKQINPQNAHLLKNIGPGRHIKVSAIMVKLSPDQSQLLIKRLGQLDSKNLDKFFLMIDDVTASQHTQATLLKALDSFVETGKPKRLLHPLSKEEIAMLGPNVPKDLKLLGTIYPQTTTSLNSIVLGITPQDAQNFILNVRRQFRGMVSDHEIYLQIDRFGNQGAKTISDLNQRFNEMLKLKEKFPDLFKPDGLMNAKAFMQERELTKLAYLDELLLNGVPMRDAKGDLIMNAEKTSFLRVKIAHLSPVKKLDALTIELQAMAKKFPCSL